jgi:hypothetical protein
MGARKKPWVMQRQIIIDEGGKETPAWVDMPIPEGMEIKSANQAKRILKVLPKGTKGRAMQVALEGSVEEVPEVATRFVVG